MQCFFFLFLYINSRLFYLSLWRMKLTTCSPSSEGNYWLIKKMYSHDGVYLHSNATWLVENNLNCDSFVPRPNQSCVSLLSSSSIYYWLAFNVCKSDTRGSRLRSTFCCNASLNMNKRINLEVIKDTTITLPSRILAMQI